MPTLDVGDLRPWVWAAVPPAVDLVYLANAARLAPDSVVSSGFGATTAPVVKALEAHAAELAAGRSPAEAVRLAADLADLFPYVVRYADAFPFVRKSFQELFAQRLYSVFDALRAWAGQLPTETDDLRLAVVRNAVASGEIPLGQAIERVASIKGRQVSPGAVRMSLRRALERERRLRHPQVGRPIVARPEPTVLVAERHRPFRVPGWLADGVAMPPMAVATLSRTLREAPEGIGDPPTAALLAKVVVATKARFHEPPAGTLGGTALLQALDVFPGQLGMVPLGDWYWEELAQLFVQRTYGIFDTLLGPGRPPGRRGGPQV